MAFSERALVETEFDRIQRARANAEMDRLPTDRELDEHLVACGFPDRRVKPRAVVPHVSSTVQKNLHFDRDQEIRQRHWQGETQRQLAARFNLSNARIAQIVKYE